MRKLRWLSISFVQRLLAFSVIAVASAQATLAAQQPPAQTLALPSAIADTTFWGMVSTMSEAGGFFQSDNFTSNEGQYPEIVSELLDLGLKGGAYVGVGPEQNFQYIAAIRPQIVFQLDIRRQMVVQHLMYKAIFELSPSRADFLSLLFSKARPAGLDSASTIDQIWDAYWFVPTDTAAFTRNFTRVRDHLTVTRGFGLTSDDLTLLRYVYETFYRNGPIVSYSGTAPNGPNFATLTWARDAKGTPRSFLATEESFRFIKDMHQRNLIIPVVADFAGATGIRNVARFLRDHNTVVKAFYVSNVESYLFRSGVAGTFYANVGALPIDSTSVFIRPSGTASTPMAIRGSSGQMSIVDGRVQATAGSTLCSIREFLAIHRATPIATFHQANGCGK